MAGDRQEKIYYQKKDVAGGKSHELPAVLHMSFLYIYTFCMQTCSHSGAKLHLFFSDGSCMCVFCAIIQGFDLCLTPCQRRIITMSNSTKNQDLTLQN